MKKYASNVIIGCLWVCVGFALCYFSGISRATSKQYDGQAEMKRMVQAINAYNAGEVTRTAMRTATP